MLRTTVLGVAGLSAAALIGCSDDDDDDGTVVGDVDPGTRSSLPEAKTFDLVAGWVKQQATEYYDFGMQSPLNAATSAVGVAAIYPFVTGIVDGMPQFVDGHHNVIDVVPGDEGYPDLWEVNLVMVDDSYVANSITSKAGIEAAGFEVVKPGLFVNCPVVGANSTLEEGPELTTGWYRDEPVFYPDFGGNDPLAIPIWVFINGFNDDGTPDFFEGQNNIIDKVPGDEGYSDFFDDDGNPQFVEGQRNVIDAIPSDDGYSAFWRLNLVVVDAGYVANTLKSADEVAASGFAVMETPLLVNCPVVDA